jgi:nucleotide-binding universal stress UspA family protein
VAKRILVPLDRTDASEAVIPFVAALAKSTGGTVRLLCVSAIPTARVTEEHRIVATADQQMERLTATTDEYLRAVAAQLDGVPVDTTVRFGRRVQEILIEAEAFDADLIAMTEPRSSALRRIVFGGEAARLVRKSHTPLLLYRHRR